MYLWQEEMFCPFFTTFYKYMKKFIYACQIPDNIIISTYCTECKDQNECSLYMVCN